MSEHLEVRDLLGPYVMGAVGPEEEREVEDHLEGCAQCSEEARDLRLAHERLVDLANTTETPPPELKSRVMTGMVRRETRRLPLVAAAAVLCVLALVGVLYSSGVLGRDEVASATLEPTDLAPGAGGEVHLYGSGDNVRVQLEAWGMPPCKSEEYYELWFVEGEERVSSGSFTIGPSGRAEVDLSAPKLAGNYPQVRVTRETTSGDPRPSARKILGGELRKL
jgi:anti-sigma-K factor RskA/putative zinc finger protein